MSVVLSTEYSVLGAPVTKRRFSVVSRQQTAFVGGEPSPNDSSVLSPYSVRPSPNGGSRRWTRHQTAFIGGKPSPNACAVRNGSHTEIWRHIKLPPENVKVLATS